MAYPGSKEVIGDDICARLNALREGRLFVEPFVGFAAIGRRMTNPRILADAHPDLIKLLIAFRDELEIRPWVSRGEYQRLPSAGVSADRGWAGFSQAYAGTWLSGYQDRPERVMIGQLANARKRLRGLVGAKIVRSYYKDLEIPEDSLVYCDIPYIGTEQYRGIRKFNHSHFWTEWVPKIAQHSLVVVSELWAPSEFSAIYRKTLTHMGGLVRFENLFVHDGQYDRVRTLLQHAGLSVCDDSKLCCV